MDRDNRYPRKDNSVFSKRVRAGRKRTYFFDVRTTKGNDYYLTITESKRRFDSGGFERHKLHLYKEDFNKFLSGLEEAVDHVKTELMPEYDFDEFTRDDDDDYGSDRDGGSYRFRDDDDEDEDREDGFGNKSDEEEEDDGLSW